MTDMNTDQPRTKTLAARPEAVAQMVLEIADDPAPPLRRLVGADVLHAARTKYEQMRALIEAASQ
jgi:hypothetical protein